MFNLFRRRKPAHAESHVSESPSGSGWRGRLQNPRLKEAEFTELAAKLASVRLRDAQVSIIGRLKVGMRFANGTQVTADLGNLWDRCVASPTERVELCERWVRSLAETGPAPGEGVIVPAIKCAEWVQEVGRKGPVKAEPLVADLWVVYAKDKPDSLEYLTDDCPFSFPELREQAVANLRGVLPQIERHGDGSTYYMLTAGGDYEASLLLLDDLWQQQEPIVKGDLVAAVPARDVLLFTGSGFNVGLRELQAAVERVSMNGSYLISKTLLVRRDNAWEEYTGP